MNAMDRIHRQMTEGTAASLSAQDQARSSSPGEDAKFLTWLAAIGVGALVTIAALLWWIL